MLSQKSLSPVSFYYLVLLPTVPDIFHRAMQKNLSADHRVQESDLRITVFAIVDQRRNPIERFDQFDYGIVSVEGGE